MLTVAYLANQYPAAVEAYVGEEIGELRRRGVNVVAGSVRRAGTARDATIDEPSAAVLHLQPVRMRTLLRALALVVKRWRQISSLVARVLLEGKESPWLRLKALSHTWLGACYAVLLRERGVDHIHVHHGYFGSWIAMVAARLLGIEFSMTLHGSDLLVHGIYLDTKLKNCQSCITISSYNRHYILEHFPEIELQKIIVSRLGVDATPAEASRVAPGLHGNFNLLAVGRLHAVKDHAFLVHACARLRDSGLDFQCAIAGEGPERRHLELLIRNHRLQDRFTLLGHTAQPELHALYLDANLVVLTSRSEGIPLVLMEAMVRGKIVLAPAITGIPELVIPGKTGFLYEPGNLDDFAQRICLLQSLMQSKNHASPNRLNWIRHAARVQILRNFSRQENLTRFGGAFLNLIAPHDWSSSHEDPVLQQI
jgi:glycosyltransferase involved in cell wall biosynthesis